jgi:chromosome partitioning protein
MPTIVFISPKGGAGKTTSALILASQLARSANVTVIDADPNHPIATWAKGPNSPENLTVISDADEENIMEKIEDAATKTPFVMVDLEGTAFKIVVMAVSHAALVVSSSAFLASHCCPAFLLKKPSGRSLRACSDKARTACSCW